MKKTILFAFSLCATIAANAQQNSGPIRSNYNPDYNLDRINVVEQGLDPLQQNNKAMIRQGGNVATLVIQNGSTGYADVNQEKFFGNENSVNIRQFGSLNSAYSFQEGFNNHAGVQQNNDNNTVDIYQLGSDKDERINQFGTMNFSSVGQLGFQNSIGIMQESTAGFVVFLQIGQANQAKVDQMYGNFNKLNVVQFSGGPIDGNGYPGGEPGYPGNGYPGNGYYGGGNYGNGPIGNEPGTGNPYGYLQELLSQYGGIIFGGNGYPSSGIIGNNFQINQSGEMNSTDMAQIGNGNRLEISQEGFDNRITGLDIFNEFGQVPLTGVQAGFDNYGFLRQTGSGNVIQYSQVGMNSQVDFEQNGNGNFARVNVTMNGNFQTQPPIRD